MVLQKESGEPLGTLPDVTIDVPWLQETGEVVAAIRRTFGISVYIARILSAHREDETVMATYLADHQSGVLPALVPSAATGSDSTHRLPWAEPGGAARELEWATSELEGLGYTVTDAMQVRTWNLSSIWRLECGDKRFWLKSVPPFFVHEPALLELLKDEPVPRLVVSAPGRSLLEDCPGIDLYDATLAQRHLMVERLVDFQWRWHERIDDLIHAGVPDHRGEMLLAGIDRALEVTLAKMEEDEKDLLSDFREQLPARLHELSQCGLPDTLTHGDYHPGNWRGVGESITVLDWGDASIGHPMMDVPPLLNTVAEADRPGILDTWHNAWQTRIPRADVKRAFSLIRPIATAHLAGIYQMFLDNIEETEQLYHRDDPGIMLARTCELLRVE